MRIAFVKTLTELAKKDPRVILLTADLGFSVFEDYMKLLPRQFINVGIAEQNMTGIAAGLAMEGRIPFIYSIVPFVTMRNFEQIRNDICYQNLNVKIVGVGAGYSYGPYGHTHHALEDIGILRTLPNLTIAAPGDPVETKLITKKEHSHVGPVYIRLGRAGEPVVHTTTPKIVRGKGITLEKGKEVCVISTSTMLYPSLRIVEELKTRKIQPTFISLPYIKPLDKKLLIELSNSHSNIVTIEEHFIAGGLATAVSEVIAQNNLSVRLLPFGVKDTFVKEIGNQEFMREKAGIGSQYVLKKIVSYISKEK